MPHGESWFNLLPFFHSVEDGAKALSAPFNDEGLTWYAHAPIGVQHVFGLAFVLILLIVMALISSSALRDTKAALIPEDKLTTRTFVEIFVTTAYTMMSDIMGRKAATSPCTTTLAALNRADTETLFSRRPMPDTWRAGCPTTIVRPLSAAVSAQTGFRASSQASMNAGRKNRSSAA